MEFYVRPIAAVIVVFVTTIALFGILSITAGYAPVSYTHLTLPTTPYV